MHNIRANFNKFYRICKELFDKEVNSRNNFQFYPVDPKMNDLQIVALSCCMEALGIDSENLLWSKLKTDYADSFKNLIDRSRFNRRRKRLSASIERVQHHVGKRLEHLSGSMIVEADGRNRICAIMRPSKSKEELCENICRNRCQTHIQTICSIYSTTYQFSKRN